MIKYISKRTNLMTPTAIKATVVDVLILGDCAKLIPTYTYRGLIRCGDIFEIIYIDQDTIRSITFKPDRTPYYSYTALSIDEDNYQLNIVLKVAASLSNSLLNSKLVFLMESMPAKLTYELFTNMSVYSCEYGESKLISDYTDTLAKNAMDFRQSFVELYAAFISATNSRILAAEYESKTRAHYTNELSNKIK